MGVKLNSRSKLAQLFDLDSNGFVLTAFDLVQQLNDSTANFNSGNPLIQASLAPSFGDISNAGKSVKGLDDRMKFMVASSMKKLLELKNKNSLSWENIQECFKQNKTLVAESSPKEIVENFTTESSSDFKFDGSPDPNLVQKVMVWWEGQACPDPDIRNDAKLDINSLAKVVAWSGATINDFSSFWSKHEQHERTLLEVGVMRYPSIAKPYFKIYRIKLHAWSDCTRTVWHQEDKNGIQSSSYTAVTSQTFKPNNKFLDQVKKEAVKTAAAEINDLFS